MEDLYTLALDHNEGSNEEPRETVTQAETNHHSELAMKAARRMRRTKHKVKTGHKVCHHLLEMIRSSEDSQPSARSAKRYHGLRHSLATDSMQPFMKCADLDITSANDRQFSLAF